MKTERMEMLEGLLKSGISPVLLEDFPANIFSDAVVLDSNCSKEDLNGHYEGISFCPPNGSTKPLSRLNAMLFIVKSRRERSSLMFFEKVTLSGCLPSL